MKHIPFTRVGYEKILEEKKSLLSSRPDAVAELKRAREMGDLSENGAYKGARFKLSDIDRRLRHLEHLIKNAQVIESVQSDSIEIGCTVVITNGSEEQTFRIVGSFESNPGKGTISHKSPIGSALIGKKAGEEVKIHIPSGTVTYKIIQITT
jgi:transcription elongation factor GreA